MQSQTEIVFPIIYGSMAFSMGNKRLESNDNTHKWICYVRGVNNEDLSYLIKKVDFVLHHSFDEPIKPVQKPPFQVKKEGWGEFEIIIRIYFQHPDMPPVEVPHHLKLHHSHTSGAQASKKPLCSQVYDEIVFTEMDEHIEKMLKGRQTAERMDVTAEAEAINQQGQIASATQPLKSIINYSKYFSEMRAEEHRNKLEDALKFITHEIKTSEEKMRNADTDLQKVYDEIYCRFP